MLADGYDMQFLQRYGFVLENSTLSKSRRTSLRERRWIQCWLRARGVTHVFTWRMTAWLFVGEFQSTSTTHKLQLYKCWSHVRHGSKSIQNKTLRNFRDMKCSYWYTDSTPTAFFYSCWFTKPRTLSTFHWNVHATFLSLLVEIFLSNCKRTFFKGIVFRFVTSCRGVLSAVFAPWIFAEAPLSEWRQSGRVWVFDTSLRRDWQPLVSERAVLGRKMLALALLIHPQLLPV